MKRPTKGYLTRRDARILRFVDRYRLATPGLLALALFDGANNEEVAARILRKLTQRGYLRREEWAPGQSYVVLTRRGCRTIGAPPRVRRPLTEQSLPAALAVTCHCVRHGLTRLNDRELRERFPELWRPGLRSSSYCLCETPRGLALTMFVVDRGGTARRISLKVRRLVAQRRGLPAFAALMAARRFQICVLTGSPEHEHNIRRQLPRLQDQPVLMDVAVVSELADLLTIGLAR